MSGHEGGAAPAREVVLVAMVAANGVIGDGGDQPWHLREDQRRFRAMTMGASLVMGRRTYEAIGRPLPGRTTVVCTRNPTWRADGVLVARSVPQAIEAAAGARPGPVYVLGGGQVYAQALPLATRVELTEIDADAPGTVRFPDLGPDWVEAARDDRAAIAFVTYTRA